jgi:hypothetical protein
LVLGRGGYQGLSDLCTISMEYKTGIKWLECNPLVISQTFYWNFILHRWHYMVIHFTCKM